MPPRNHPLPNAVNVFNCDICEKGYPRQVDYENHLSSYDHTHRQRLADMKKLTAANEGEGSNRPNKGPLDMRNIAIGDGSKMPGLSKGFKRIGDEMPAPKGRFKKVGVTVSGTGSRLNTVPVTKTVSLKEAKTEDAPQVETAPSENMTQILVTDAISEQQVEPKKDEDVAMGETEEMEVITWEEYDVTKPTGCDHANCPGCMATGTYDEDGWVVLESAEKEA